MSFVSDLRCRWIWLTKEVYSRSKKHTKKESCLNNNTTKRGERKMKTAKEVYARPVLTKHGLLRDITASFSGGGGGIKGRIEEIICRVFPQLPRCN